MDHEANALFGAPAVPLDDVSGSSSDAPLEEWRLVAAARADLRAFAPLYRGYVMPVYRYLAQQVGSPQDAEDLTAATFSKALASLCRYREQGAFAAWLFTIARHTLRDYQRRRRPSVEIGFVASAVADPAAPIEARLLEAEQAETLHRLVEQLPAAQRDALALHFFAELGIGQVAAVLGRSEGSVRMLMHRAVTTLRVQYHREEQS